MAIQYKAFGVPHLKVFDDLPGTIEAIVSVFGNRDRAGEVVEQGFFAESLTNKLPKGAWAHDWKQPVAKTLEARELPPGDPLLPASLTHLGGLYIKGQFNLDTQRGKEAYSDIKFGIVDEFSIGYDVTEDRYNKETKTRHLIKGQLYEWSPVLVGANEATALISVKSGEGAKRPVAVKSATDLSANDLWALLEQELNEDFGDPEADWWDERYRVRDVVQSTIVVYTRGYDPDGPLFTRTFAVTDGNDVTWDDEVEVVRATRYLPVTEAPGMADRDDAAAYEGKGAAPRPGQRFPDHTEGVRLALDGWVTRAHGIRAMYAKEGRALNSSNRELLGGMRDGLQGYADDLTALLDATDPDNVGDKAAIDRELMRFLALESQLVGVDI